MAQTWLDYYKIITSQAQVGTALRNSPAYYSLPSSYFGTNPKVMAAAKKSTGTTFGNIASGGINIGKRLLDVLARFNYASANIASKVNEQNRAGRWNDYNIGDVLKMYGEQAAAGWEGLSGQKKKTFSDVFKENPQLGLPTSGVGGFAAGFGADVVLDPTTYVGVGLVKRVLGAGSKGLLKGTPKVAGPVEQAVQEAATTGTTKVATKNAQKFYERISKTPAFRFDESGNATGIINANAQGITHAMPNVGKAAGPSSYVPTPKVGSTLPKSAEPRHFNVTPEGVASERLQIAGPPAKIVGARAQLASIEESLKNHPVPALKYGNELENIPKTGFWKEVSKRVPIEPKNIPTTEPKPTAATKGEDAFRKTIAEAILKNPNEKIYVRQPFGASKTKALKTIMAARRTLKTTGTGKGAIKQYEELGQAITAHIDRVVQHAKEEISRGTFKDLTEYMRANGYKVPTGGVRSFKLTPIEPFKLEAAPTWTEVKSFVKMTPAEKLAFFSKHQFLDPQHARYLAQASNIKSFQTRLAKIGMVTRPTNGIDELIDALKNGTIKDTASQGIPELLQATGTKTLKQLEKALISARHAAAGADKAMEAKILGQANIGKLVRPGFTEVPQEGTLGWFFGKDSNLYKSVQERVAKEVKPAEAIVNEVKNGNKIDLARTTTTLSVNQGKLLDDALKMAMDREVIAPNSPLYPYLTKRGFKRTSKIMNKGLGRNPGVWNKFSQYTMTKSLMAHSKELDDKIKAILEAQGAKVAGKDARYARAQAYHDLFMPVFRSFDNVLKSGGVFPVSGITSASPSFSLVDVLDSLPEEWVVKHFFTIGKGSDHIPPTMLMDAMTGLVNMAKNGTLPEQSALAVRALLEHGTTRGGKQFTNFAATKFRSLKSEAAKKAYFEDLHNALVDAVPRLMKRTEENIAEFKLWHDNNIDKITTSALDDLAKLVTDPENGPGDLINLAANTDEITVKAAQRLHSIDPNDMWAAKQNVRAKLEEQMGLTPEAAANGAAAESMAKAATKDGKLKVGARIAEESAQQADEAAVGIPINSYDLGQKFERHFLTRMFKGIAPHLGNADIRPFYLNRHSFTQTYSRKYAGLLSQISRNHTSEAYNTAWKELQRGTRSTNPEVLAAQDDLSQAVSALFAKDDAFDVFSRNNLTPAQVNEHFSHYGIHPKFNFSDEIPMNQQWKMWDTDNPLDLLSRVQSAVMATMSKRLLADDLAFRFGSKSFQQGMVKVRPGASVLGKYLDTSLYYPREIAQQFHVLDDFMKRMTEPVKHGDVQKFLNFYDNVLHSYKAGLTIYRPGHHVRNMVGDVWLSYMAGVSNPLYYTRALKIMAQNHARYDTFDAIAAFMSRQPITPNGTGVIRAGKFIDNGKPIARIRIKGSAGTDLSGGEVYRAMADNGLLNDYRTLEDIQMGSETWFQTHKPFGGKLQKAAASTSEARDHYVRVAQFLYELEKKPYRSLREAIDEATRQTRKWHPDGTDLAGFETKVMRRTFLFYSWIRKAIPLVAESMVMHPGKAMVYPKFMYNIAEAQGINLNSYEDPFPADQLFPDWIKDQIVGPVTQMGQDYIGMSPGVPMADVLHDFGGTQALNNVLGATTPLLKVPFEIATRPPGGAATDVRTGVPQYDMTDYIDKQLPGAGYAANITGRSPSSLFTQYKGGTPQQGQAPPGFNALALLNLLSGMSFQNYSKPNYIKQARKQQQDRRTQERRKRRQQ